MPPPITSVGTPAVPYVDPDEAARQEFRDWQDAFPGSVPMQSTVAVDGVVVSDATQAYACGQDAEIDAAVCTNGLANPDAGIIDIHDQASAAEIARRTGQTNGWTRDTFERHWNIEHYTSRGLPVPPPTPESKRRIDEAFLAQQHGDSTRVLHNWYRMDNAANIGNAIAMETVTVASTFMLGAGMFIDNPALLAKGIIASEVAPMLTSSGGSDGGMGTVVSLEAGFAAPAFEGRAAAAEAPALLRGGPALTPPDARGLNWNPLRGRSLAESLPVTGGVTTVGPLGKAGPQPVQFLELKPPTGGGRIYASTDVISNGHVDDLTQNLLNGPLAQGRDIHIISGRHGAPGGFDLMTAESKFVLEDYGIAPGAKNLTIHDATTMSAADMNAVLNGGHDVILGWCHSENSRQVMRALGLDFLFAPF